MVSPHASLLLTVKQQRGRKRNGDDPSAEQYRRSSAPADVRLHGEDNAKEPGIFQNIRLFFLQVFRNDFTSYLAFLGEIQKYVKYCTSIDDFN